MSILSVILHFFNNPYIIAFQRHPALLSVKNDIPVIFRTINAGAIRELPLRLLQIIIWFWHRCADI